MCIKCTLMYIKKAPRVKGLGANQQISHQSRLSIFEAFGRVQLSYCTRQTCYIKQPV